MDTCVSPSRIRCHIDLPAHFRHRDILEFHGRDRQAVAEHVTADSLRKGIVWHGYPACLNLSFSSGSVFAELELAGPESAADPAAFSAMLRRMLGLTQPVEAFEASHGKHPQLGPLLARQRGLRVPLAATPFEALSWAVSSQQISLAAAVTVRRKLILMAGPRHSGGLLCYPDAAHIAALEVEDLRRAGYSQTKAMTLLTLGRMVAAQALPLDAWLTKPPPVEEIRAHLLAIHGVGPWTVDYALLRGLGWLNGSLHKDAGVRHGLQRLLQRVERMDETETREWLAQFSPWRALVAAHLWASNALSENACRGDEKFCCT